MTEHVKLADIAEVKLGMAFKSAINDIEEAGDVFLIQSGDLSQDGSIEEASLARIDSREVDDRYFLSPEDLVLRLRGPLFSAAVIDNRFDIPVITTNQMAVIRVKGDATSPHFLHWYLNSSEGKKIFKAISEGTSISKLNVKAVSELIIPLPPVENQVKITAIWRNWLMQRAIYKEIVSTGDSLFEKLCFEIQTK